MLLLTLLAAPYELAVGSSRVLEAHSIPVVKIVKTPPVFSPKLKHIVYRAFLQKLSGIFENKKNDECAHKPRDYRTGEFLGKNLPKLADDWW